MSTKIDLDEHDCAIVFTADGDRETVIPEYGDDDNGPLTPAMAAVLLCTVMLDDPYLRHMVQERTKELMNNRRKH